MSRKYFVVSVCVALFAAWISPPSASAQIGIFDDHLDIYMDFDRLGADGGAEFDEGTGTYTIWGSGWDVWAADDAFQFVYTELSGDFILDAVGEWDMDRTTSTDEWIKMMLMARGDLDHDSQSYATRVREDGQYSWQYRPAKGAAESLGTPGDDRVVFGPSGINLPVWKMRLQRIGDEFTTWYQSEAGEWIQVGAAVTLEIPDPIYVGLGVTAHQVGTLAYGLFSEVTLNQDPTVAVRSFSIDVIQAGESVDVTLSLQNPSENTLIEILPEGWTADNISDGGELDGNVITWQIDANTTTLTYTATASIDAQASAFSGEVGGIGTSGQSSVTLLDAGLGDFTSQANIGNSVGEANYDAGQYTLEAASGDIEGTADNFLFVFSEMSGSLSIKGNVFVFPLEGNQEWTKGGFMIRDNLTPGSANAYVHARSDMQIRRQMRTEQGGGTSGSALISTDNQLGDIELERVGDTFNFYYYDFDGERVLFDTQVIPAIQDPIYVGIALTSNSAGNFSELEVMDVEITEYNYSITRDIEAPFMGHYLAGAESTANVEVTLDVRDDYTSDASYTEQLPEGWSATDISATNGEASFSGGVINWQLSGAEGTVQLSYTMEIPANANQLVSIEGNIEGQNVVSSVRPIFASPDPIFDYHLDIYSTYDRLSMDGSLEYEDGVYTIWASGWDIWDADDAGHFLFTEVSGDFEFIATGEWDWDRTTSTDEWIKMMLWARQDLSHGAVNFGTRVREDGQYSWQARFEADGGSSSDGDNRVVFGEGGLNLEEWTMRLVREGNQWSIYYMEDFGPQAGEWVQVQSTQTLEMQDPILVGLGVTSHQLDTLAYGVFTNVSLEVEEPVTVSDWALY